MSDLRRNQLVVPFGVGASYDYLHYSAMTMTVDKWNIDSKLKENLAIKDSRLINYVNKRLKDLEGDTYSKIEFICAPPIANQINPTSLQKAITHPYMARKFPKWGVCSRCYALSQFDYGSQEKNKICNNDNVPDRMKGAPSCKKLGNGGGRIETVRFIAFCPDGHIQDLPYLRHMTRKCKSTCDLESYDQFSSSATRLYLFDDNRGHGFNSLKLHCGFCKNTTSLKGLMDKKAREKMLDKTGAKLYKCNGCKPWTGEVNDECDLMLDISPRTSSRVYMPIQQSSIFIPETEESMHIIFDDENIYNLLDEDISQPDIENFLKIYRPRSKHNLSNEEIIYLIQKERDRQKNILEIPEEESSDIDISFLKKEFDTLIQENVSDEDFVSNREKMDDYSETINRKIKSLHSVSKLVSTTVLLGFKRGDDKSKFNPSRINEDFMPAFKVIGEGIFINFGFEKISSWKHENPNLINRIKQLKKNSQLDYMEHKERFFDAGYVLIHTFSHMLMRQLEIECGYSLTELKERIYFDNDEKMAGLLIYTASADSQGSLGGLVRTIKPNFFEKLFANAIENSYTCFNDPICIESEGQGHSGLCLAACHACSMVPDLACETLPKNIFLDRNMLIGNDENALGYFTSL